MKKIITTALIIMSIFSFYHPSQTFACSCAMPESPKKEMKRADYVFVWTVSNIDTISSMEEFLPGEKFERKSKKVTLNNISNIKWVSSDSFTLTTPDQSASCGVNFQENKEYIVYAHEQENWDIWAWLCGRTSLTEYAEEDLKVFKSILEENKNNAIPVDYDDLPQNKYFKIITVLIWVLLLSIAWIYKLSKKDVK